MHSKNAALPFIPIDDVDQVFITLIMATAPTDPHIPQAVTDFLDYVVDTWLDYEARFSK